MSKYRRGDSLRRKGGGGLVSVSQRGLGPVHPDIQRNCWGRKWAKQDTPLCHISPSGCVCLPDSWGGRSTSYSHMCLSFIPPSSSVTFYFFPSLSLDLSFDLYPSISLFLQLFLSVCSPRHPWPTCGFIGQLPDDFRSVLFNSLPVGVSEMSYLPQLSLQK